MIFKRLGGLDLMLFIVNILNFQLCSIVNYLICDAACRTWNFDQNSEITNQFLFTLPFTSVFKLEIVWFCGSDWQDTYNEQNQLHPSVLEELRSQVKKTEAELRDKEAENAILKLQIKEYEARWSAYELKMKSMEENWQKQLTSLQVNI